MALIKWKKNIKEQSIRSVEKNDDKILDKKLNDGVLKKFFLKHKFIGFIIAGFVISLIFLFFESIYNFIFLTQFYGAFKIKFVGAIYFYKIFLFLLICHELNELFAE